MLCISSIVFLVVLTLRVVAATGRAPGGGYLERVLALFVLLRALVQGNTGMRTSCQAVNLPRFI